MNNSTQARKITTISLIIIVALLLVLNLDFVRLHFLIFSLQLPLIVVMWWMFIAWRYTSKSFWGTFSKAQLEEKLSSVEKTVGNSVEKATETIKDAVEDIKDQIDEVKKPTTTRKTTTKKAPVKKPTTKK